MQRFFFAHGLGTHKAVFDYCRGRFVEVFKGEPDRGRKDIPIYSERVDADFVDYIDKLVYHTCDGKPSDIEALEKRRTFVEFLSIINNHLEKLRIRNTEQEKQNQLNS